MCSYQWLRVFFEPTKFRVEGDERESGDGMAQPQSNAVLVEEIRRLSVRLSDSAASAHVHFEVLTLQLFDLKHTLKNLSRRLTHTEEQMALDAATMQQQLADATNQLAANWTAIRDQLTAALAAVGAGNDAAVQAVLAGFQPQIDALTQMGVDENNPIVPVPPVEPAPV